ncbi:cation:dicarboxylase symporter family transporter [Nocardia huaxiensis]|uniref:Cation:dicarboxylase symporter family transporter n=1 Tax=Nocardia huaxiensis TaxID=2755382 RepID=A0A7D6VF98_9NOCA|nr:cation:dicarboxylase symporter family transporter [Nocardia huaxiensis]QLY31617.1 cation:dicarboxylase symporter family transporter [Nocardia huaxiensis]
MSSTALDTAPESAARPPRWRRVVTNTSFQVLVAAVAAAVFGIVAPEAAAGTKPIATAFIALIQMLIAPIVFLVIVTGIVTAGGMKAVGRIAARALIYFEIVTTAGMLLGLLAVNLFQPGSGVAPPQDASDDVSSYVKGGAHTSFGEFLIGMVPDNAVNAFASGHILQVLIFAVLFAIAVVKMPAAVRDPIVDGCTRLAQILFRMIGMIMLLAPIGTFGAVASTVGKYGPATLTALMKLVAVSALALAVFVFLGLGLVCRLAGFSLFRLIRTLRRELMVVVGTSSSEAVLPQLMERMEEAGCRRSVVGLVVPTGFSFNLDGVAVVIPICVVFIGQVYGIPLTFADQFGLFLVFLLLSKGTAGISGSAFITLANTVAATALVPVAGLALVLSVDRFLSLIRALTNVLGNAVATVVVARWEPGGLDPEAAAPALGFRPKTVQGV